MSNTVLYQIWTIAKTENQFFGSIAIALVLFSGQILTMDKNSGITPEGVLGLQKICISHGQSNIKNI